MLGGGWTGQHTRALGEEKEEPGPGPRSQLLLAGLVPLNVLASQAVLSPRWEGASRGVRQLDKGVFVARPPGPMQGHYNWVAGLGGQLLSHLFPLLSHSLLSPLWKWVSGRRKIREGSQGSQFCSSSYPLPGPWAFSLRPLGLKGWVAGVLLDKS